MIHRNLIFAIGASVLLFGDITTAQQKIQLNISATIPPRPCTYPEYCPLVGPSAITSATVADGIVRYVGSRPSVTYTDDLITIIF